MMSSKCSLKITLLIFCLIVFWGGLSANLFADDLSESEYTIGPEDILEIQVWGNGDLNRTVEVSQEGTFTFLLIGKVHAEGLSLFELEDLIEKRLADGYILEPQVTVSINEYQNKKVFLLGEVKVPGSYVLKRKTHILELISEAGGFTDKASRTVKIVRSKSLKHGKERISPSGNEKNEVFTLDLNKYENENTYETFAVVSGDHIYVEEETRFFVVGEVGRRGEFKWEEGMTVRLALSLAGGTTKMAAEKRTKIIRVKNGKGEELKVNMDDLVMPDDIITVPGRYF